MESQLRNPEFRINPENFHPHMYKGNAVYKVDCKLQPKGASARKLMMGVHMVME